MTDVAAPGSTAASPPHGASPARRAAGLRWRHWARARGAPPTLPSTPPGALADKAAFLRRLELDVTRRLDGLVSGDYLTRASGPGTEPASARPYIPGDDARRIDWSLSARVLTPHVRTTEADRELETWIVVDRSASLDFGTANHEKREVALAGVAAFGFLTIRAGNRLGVVVAGGDELVRLPPRSGRGAVLAALSVLYDSPRRDRGPAQGADLGSALAQVERTQRRRGQVIVVSDFLDTTDWATPLRRLALRHQVIAVQVSDPREFELPPVGMLDVVDTETGTRMHVQTNSAELRERFSAAVAARQDDIRRLLGEAGAEHVELSTSRDWVTDVARFLRRRRSTGRATAARRIALTRGGHPAGGPARLGAASLTPAGGGRASGGDAPMNVNHGGIRP
ncbi:MAG TPA: DUF58 domain-containing protein [Acidimicrobiales bacterium]|nr:DUF58 domain-containing protein [Acidimicrobiales bacterium]